MLDIPASSYHLERGNRLEQVFYGRCYIEKAAAWTYYRQGCKAQQLIHRLKYGGVRPIGTYLGRMYGNIIRDSDFCSGIDCLAAVPLHPSKERKRGFNQSRLIAEGMAGAMDLPFIPGLLERRRSSDTQTNKHRYDRWMNVEGIFRLKKGAEIAGKHILLVDDVITTGSTMEACASELLKIQDVKVSLAAIAAAEK